MNIKYISLTALIYIFPTQHTCRSKSTVQSLSHP